MTERLGGRSQTTTFDLEELVRLVGAGRIRIPHFQRGFRWESRDVLRLFDSIVKGYPVGSLLLWQRPAAKARVTLGALEIDAPAVESALWVVDGQQRITALVNALDDRGLADDRFGVSFDLKQGRFTSAKEADPVRYIPLPDLFDLPRLLAWFQKRTDLTEHLAQVNDVATSLRKYEIPAYVVDEADPKVLQDIFDRMNNYGKRLSRAEVFSALYAPEESRADEDLTLAKIADRIDEIHDFGHVDEDTVLRAVLARRGPDVTREIRSEFLPIGAPGAARRTPVEFPDESRDEAHVLAEAAISRAVAFLQKEVGVPHVSFLPYRYLLVVLVRFFAYFPEPRPRNAELLRRWFWRAALVGPGVFKGSTYGAMRVLAGQIRIGEEDTAVRGLHDALGETVADLPDLGRFKTSEAATRIVLCAMWSLSPQMPDTGWAYGQQALAAALRDRTTAKDVALEIFPRRLIPVELRPAAANRILLPVPEEERAADPQELVSELLSNPLNMDVLTSHILDTDCLVRASGGDLEGFLRRRSELLRTVVERFLSRGIGRGFELTPPLDRLVVDDEDWGDEAAERAC